MVRWVNDQVCPCVGVGLIPSPVQWVKGGSIGAALMWLRLDLWPRNFHRLQGWPRGRRRRKKEEEEEEEKKITLENETCFLS